jgi:hypothetical protein
VTSLYAPILANLGKFSALSVARSPKSNDQVNWMNFEKNRFKSGKQILQSQRASGAYRLSITDKLTHVQFPSNKHRNFFPIWNRIASGKKRKARAQFLNQTRLRLYVSQRKFDWISRFTGLRLTFKNRPQQQF